MAAEWAVFRCCRPCAAVGEVWLGCAQSRRLVSMCSSRSAAAPSTLLIGRKVFFIIWIMTCVIIHMAAKWAVFRCCRPCAADGEMWMGGARARIPVGMCSGRSAAAPSTLLIGRKVFFIIWMMTCHNPYGGQMGCFSVLPAVCGG